MPQTCHPLHRCPYLYRHICHPFSNALQAVTEMLMVVGVFCTVALEEVAAVGIQSGFGILGYRCGIASTFLPLQLATPPPPPIPYLHTHPHRREEVREETPHRRVDLGPKIGRTPRRAPHGTLHGHPERPTGANHINKVEA